MAKQKKEKSKPKPEISVTRATVITNKPPNLQPVKGVYSPFIHTNAENLHQDSEERCIDELSKEVLCEDKEENRT